MGPANQIEIMLVQELGNDLTTECEADAAVILAPASDVLVGVGPEQIAEEALVGHIGWSHDAADLLHGLQVRRQTTMAAEDFLVDNCGDWETVETVGKCFPQFNVVASFAYDVIGKHTFDYKAFFQNYEYFM